MPLHIQVVLSIRGVIHVQTVEAMWLFVHDTAIGQSKAEKVRGGLTGTENVTEHFAHSKENIEAILLMWSLCHAVYGCPLE